MRRLLYNNVNYQWTRMCEMSSYYLAIDIGASSGRHILGSVQNGKLMIEEIYRFDNGIRKENGHFIWDIDALFTHVKEGIGKCRKLGKLPKTIAIDTWGVDYVLLDADKRELLPAAAYRDGRTDDVLSEVDAILPQSVLYAKTGIQRQPFNTLYQLYCDKKSGKLDRASHFLMMPDYLAFRLTGEIRHEYTNATTTGMLNAASRTWDKEIIESLGLPSHLFGELSQPCTSVGRFSETVKDELGFDSEVILCASHDTASAVAACPIDENCVYISSGTWSLIGTENALPILSEQAMSANFTNEGGFEYRYRFLKNIMGMWLFQNIRHEIGNTLTYDEMMNLAMKSGFKEIFDLTSPDLAAPESMTAAVRGKLNRSDLPLADLLSSVYHSLAASYRKAVEEIEQISSKTVSSVCIVGGGSRDQYLNRLTAKYTGKTVLTGLTEATAVGNLLTQIMYDQKITLAEARKIVNNTYKIKETI